MLINKTQEALEPIEGLADALRHDFADADVSDEDDHAVAVLWEAAQKYLELTKGVK